VGLLGGKNVDKAVVKRVELIGGLDVPVQGGGVELRKQVNLVVAGVDAVADGDVDEAVFATERDGGLATVFGERVEPAAAAAAHDDGDNARGHGSLI